MISDLKTLQHLAKKVQEDLENLPKLERIQKLLDACEELDFYYEEWCLAADASFTNSPGTAYKEGGIRMEFYIESSAWHDVSKQLRELRPRTPLQDLPNE